MNLIAKVKLFFGLKPYKLSKQDYLDLTHFTLYLLYSFRRRGPRGKIWGKTFTEHCANPEQSAFFKLYPILWKSPELLHKFCQAFAQALAVYDLNMNTVVNENKWPIEEEFPGDVVSKVFNEIMNFTVLGNDGPSAYMAKISSSFPPECRSNDEVYERTGYHLNREFSDEEKYDDTLSPDTVEKIYQKWKNSQK
jgi:hypothetical protein